MQIPRWKACAPPCWDRQSWPTPLRLSQRAVRAAHGPEVIAMSDGSDTESVHSVRGEAVRARPRSRLVIVSQPDQEVLSDNDTESVDGASQVEVSIPDTPLLPLRWNPDAV